MVATLVLALVLTACGGSDDPGDSAGTASTSATTASVLGEELAVRRGAEELVAPLRDLLEAPDSRCTRAHTPGAPPALTGWGR